jgi:hypothetical protein
MRLLHTKALIPRWLAVLACSCLLLHCAAPSKVDLVGTYAVNYGFAEETLTLHESGAYEQHIQLQGEEELVSHTGQWEYQERVRNVVLVNPLVVYSLSGRLRADYKDPVEGLVLLLAKRSLRGIRLAVSEDLDLYFDKRSS